MRRSISLLMVLFAFQLFLASCSLLNPSKEYTSSFGRVLGGEFESWRSISFDARETSSSPNFTGDHRVGIEAGYRIDSLPFPRWQADFHVDTLRMEFIGQGLSVDIAAKQFVSSVDVIEGSGPQGGRIRTVITESPDGCFRLDPSYTGLRAVTDTFRNFNPGPAVLVDSFSVSFPGCEFNQENRLVATQFIGSTQQPLSEDGVRNLINPRSWLGHFVSFGTVHIPSEVDSIRVSFTIEIVDHFADSVIASKLVDLRLERGESVFSD